jgi:hypothetical protein
MYEISNPSKTIVTHHLHNSNFRINTNNDRENDRVGNYYSYHFIEPSEL